MIELENKKRILFSENDIQVRVKEISSILRSSYSDLEDIVIIGVMKGAINFTIDIAKEINRSVVMDWLSISSYREGDQQSELRLLKDIEIDIKDKHVVVIEDILDSGRTLDFIRNLLIRRAPKSLKICVLLKKEDSQRYDINPDFIGFHLNNIHWVGGYGIDYNEKYRNLKNIYEIEHKSI